jgi:hypothetical protein
VSEAARTARYAAAIAGAIPARPAGGGAGGCVLAMGAWAGLLAGRAHGRHGWPTIVFEAAPEARWALQTVRAAHCPRRPCQTSDKRPTQHGRRGAGL